MGGTRGTGGEYTAGPTPAVDRAGPRLLRLVQGGGRAGLVVPGWVGDDWVKWLSELAVLAEEPKGFFYETAYRIPKTPGPPGQAVPPEQMDVFFQQLAMPGARRMLRGFMIFPSGVQSTWTVRLL